MPESRWILDPQEPAVSKETLADPEFQAAMQIVRNSGALDYLLSGEYLSKYDRKPPKRNPTNTRRRSTEKHIDG